MNPTSSHGQDTKGHTFFSAQKAEKLATAVYMVTDIIDAREPLRWKVREEAMEILSLTSTPAGDVSTRMNVLYRTTQAIERILHVLSIAQNTKLISTMNASIVIKEYTDLKERISHTQGEGADDHTPKLNHQFFKVESLPSSSGQSVISASHFPKSDPQHSGQNLDILSGPTSRISGQTLKHSKRSDLDVPVFQNHIPASPALPIGHTVAPRSAVVFRDIEKNQKDTVSDSGSAQEKKSSRASAILTLLRSKPEISVSDAMKLFPGVSDKTVQRELVAMVEAGILVKKGDKRWSVYMLRT